MDSVRWGLLSTARINRRLIGAIRASRRATLAAVASRDGERAERYARQWEIPRAFGSYEAMLESDSVDVVYISLPNHLHARWSVRALETGKHVLCEKPLALSLQEVDEMTEASRGAGRVLAEAFMYRHHPQTRILGEWIRSGRIGEILSVRSGFDFLLQPREDIRLVPAFGGGCLWDVGGYPISIIQFILGGPPTRVSAVRRTGESGVDVAFSGLLLCGETPAQLACSFRRPVHMYAEILGIGGTLILNRPFVNLDENRSMVFYPAAGDPEEISVPEKHLYLGEVEDMNQAVLEGSAPLISLEESRNHIRTALALHEAARTRTWVSL
jgi:predicted dehydrogenase